MNDRKTLTAVCLFLVPALLLALMLSLVLLQDSSAACNPTTSGPGVIVDPETVPRDAVAGYSGTQLVNAAVILKAGADLGLDARDQTIGVMTAMGESSLTVVNHGDAVGPDSRGLFQQRANGAWGSYADRMDPYTSAQNFFRVLMGIANRTSLAPTIAAHQVQRNADPYHYAKYWDPAVAVVQSLAGTDIGLSAGGGNQICNAPTGTPGQVNAQGWAKPGDGPIVSEYGMRTQPVLGVYRRHAGVDLHAGGCDGPIWAAHDGTVIFAGMYSDGTGAIEVDHGSGLVTRYLHMYANGILVHVGDHVRAGQQIARVGNTGDSTGCHLHYETRINDSPTDPVPFMRAVGVPLA
jgi:murein DD-endopeptidase MepM/ murein hydrolase activator NlpD